MTRTEDHPPGLLARAVRRLLLLLYRVRGWRAVGTVPEPRRFIIIAAPHTSNWDFVNFLGLTADVGIRPHFMAKLSLFKWPLGGFIRQMGGIPVDRTKASNAVQQMVDQFARRAEFILTVAPEGTRGRARKWRTGFYQIALAAKVPLVVGLMDYGTKTGGLGPMIWPSGDFRADMQKVFEVYKNCVPRHPDRAVRSINDILGDDTEAGAAI
ncbi:lysophospholipid acyltransferase family protein [Sphingopyxis sp. XHP0097]|uniref:Lysophospholipid acyltransferase family protein n=1 Tax=Sphingopyxis jiangsuensis TaxID=2871171 RepID=A0ABS7MG74_9SPHN|nr:MULTISPECIES: lysophospholipid acyltransferase family protein [Sphingopyxis]MBL0768935.1 lysophospholipid acyltransferase family protein [Sphingopyxis lutea]MBY4637959.1 lysophospholipid acyltransferase family protein [Sphingopyxis jiangsuensis]